jgi:hypothetical protein
VAAVPIQVWPVAPLLIAATLALKWAQRKFAPAEKASKKTPWTGEERIRLAACGVVGLILLVHSARTPFGRRGYAVPLGHLAQLIGQAVNFNFYPPLKPADFRSYFFVDGIPPLVS